MILFFILCSLFCLILFVYRIRAHSGEEVSAVIVEISEGELELMDRFTSFKYYYPIMRYQFDFRGETLTHEISKSDSRIYRVEEISAFGDVNPDEKFFWRQLSRGDSIQCLVVNKNKSHIVGKINKKIKSENYVFLVLGVIAGAIALSLRV